MNTTCGISKLSQIQSCITPLTAREIMYNNFEISLVVFMPNITTNHAITYTNCCTEELLITSLSTMISNETA